MPKGAVGSWRTRRRRCTDGPEYRVVRSAGEPGLRAFLSGELLSAIALGAGARGCCAGRFGTRAGDRRRRRGPWLCAGGVRRGASAVHCGHACARHCRAGDRSLPHGHRPGLVHRSAGFERPDRARDDQCQPHRRRAGWHEADHRDQPGRICVSRRSGRCRDGVRSIDECGDAWRRHGGPEGGRSDPRRLGARRDGKSDYGPGGGVERVTGIGWRSKRMGAGPDGRASGGRPA